MPLVTPPVRTRLYGAITDVCRELRCTAIAIGGRPDYVHVLAILHPTVSVSELVKRIKGASSHLATHEIRPDSSFKWQGGYGAFTLSQDAVEAVVAYVKNQDSHHGAGSLQDHLEQTFIEIDSDLSHTPGSHSPSHS